MLEEVLRHDSIEADEEEILETVLRYAQDQVYQRFVFYIESHLVFVYSLTYNLTFQS